MRVLLSTVGTRGDVQPVVALALEVRALGHEVCMCVPPNFVDWVVGLGFEARSVGVEMRQPKAAPGASAAAPLTTEELRRLRETMPDLITDQFDVVGAAAEGCDAILGGGAHQYAARSIAERHGIRYVDAVYAPVALPSPDHAPPGQVDVSGNAEQNDRQWTDHARSWNERSLERVNANRARLGLAPVTDVLHYILTDEPWLAADAVLGPAPSTRAGTVVQTGAWILPDTAPLAPELEHFLDNGAPPVYLGLGSMPAQESTSRTLIDAARATGRRVILSQGWAELGLIDDRSDCIAIGEVNQQALFPRVAAVVHHGGAGTTTAAARAGAPQVAIAMYGDQFYWGRRIQALGIGTSLPNATLTVEGLVSALRDALDPAIAKRAQLVAEGVTADGAAIAARRLVAAHP